MLKVAQNKTDIILEMELAEMKRSEKTTQRNHLFHFRQKKCHRYLQVLVATCLQIARDETIAKAELRRFAATATRRNTNVILLKMWLKPINQQKSFVFQIAVTFKKIVFQPFKICRKSFIKNIVVFLYFVFLLNEFARILLSAIMYT